MPFNVAHLKEDSLSNKLVAKMREARLRQNSTGFPGVRAFRNKWHARVTVNGKRISSRGFDTREQAAKWREAQIERQAA